MKYLSFTPTHLKNNFNPVLPSQNAFLPKMLFLLFFISYCFKIVTKTETHSLHWIPLLPGFPWCESDLKILSDNKHITQHSS